MLSIYKLLNINIDKLASIQLYIHLSMIFRANNFCVSLKNWKKWSWESHGKVMEKSWNFFYEVCRNPAARARVRCAWAKFKELSSILTARDVSHRMKGKIFRACVQSVLIYGTETWAMKAENLRSLERTERMMVRWMCGVSLNF